MDCFEFMVSNSGTYIISSQYNPSISLDLYASFYHGYEYVTYNDNNPDDVDVNFKITVELEANTLYVVAVQTYDHSDSGEYAVNIERQLGEEQI